MTTSKPTSLPILSVDFMTVATLALLPRLFCVSIYILLSLLFLGFLFASVYLSFSILCTCKCLFHCSPLFKPLTLFFFEWAFSLTLYPFSVFFYFIIITSSHCLIPLHVYLSFRQSFRRSFFPHLFLSFSPSFHRFLSLSPLSVVISLYVLYIILTQRATVGLLGTRRNSLEEHNVGLRRYFVNVRTDLRLRWYQFVRKTRRPIDIVACNGV